MKKIRVFWNLEKEEQWLNEMNEKGFEFVKRLGCHYQFRTSKEKGKFIYCIDVKRKQDVNFKEFIENLNIKLISKNLMLYYYQIPKESGIQGLYTDSKSRMFLYLRYILCLLLLGCVNVLILHNVQGPYILNFSIPFVLNLISLGVVIYAIIQYIKNIIFLIYKEV